LVGFLLTEARPDVIIESFFACLSCFLIISVLFDSSIFPKIGFSLSFLYTIPLFLDSFAINVLREHIRSLVTVNRCFKNDYEGAEKHNQIKEHAEVLLLGLLF
jgi:hypothetical protein